MTEMYVIKCGNCTPLGERAGVTAASVRAGFSEISIIPEIEDNNWEPIRLGLASYIHKSKQLEDQFNELAQPAFEEAVSPLGELSFTSNILPVLIGLPEDRPGLLNQIEAVVEQPIKEALESLNLTPQVEFIKFGHTSGISALEKAFELMETYEFCMIGGVDSYNNISTIRWLENDIERLFCTANKKGFIPGQAAGFVLLASEPAIKKYKLSPLAKIFSCAAAEEENSFESGKLSTGRGLTKTIRQNLKSIPDEVKIDEIYSTLNGEFYHTQEYAYAVLNIGERIKEVSNLVAPYICWGDIGAASVPVLIGLATEAGKKGYAKGPINLITAANFKSHRASALIELLNLE